MTSLAPPLSFCTPALWHLQEVLLNYACCTLAPSCGLFSSSVTENLNQKKMKHAGHQLYLCYCEQGTWLKGLSNCPAEHRRTETLVVCSSSAVFRLLSLWRFKHSSFSLSFYLRATELKVNLGQERLVCSGSKKLWALVIQWVQAESFLSKHSPRNSVAHRAAFSPRNKTASKLSGLCPKEPTITTFKTKGSSMKGVGVTQQNDSQV